MITTLACITLMLPASAAEVGCQFDVPPIIEKALTRAYRPKGPQTSFVPWDLRELISQAVSNSSNESGSGSKKACPHGVAWPTICKDCIIQPTPVDTIPPVIAARFQETLTSLTSGVTNRKLQQANYEALVKNLDTVAALQVIESYLRRAPGTPPPPGRSGFERSGGREMDAIMKKGGIGAEMIYMAQCVISISAKEGNVKWQSDPLWVYKVRQCVWSMRIGNSLMANALVAAAVYQVPVKDTIPPVPIPIPR